VARRAKARFVLGLSATVTRKDAVVKAIVTVLPGGRRRLEPVRHSSACRALVTILGDESP